MEMPDFIYVLPSYEGNESGFYDLDPRDGDKYHNSRVVEALQKENEENCRLLGMSAERELALLAEIDRLKAKLAKTEWQPINIDTSKTEKILIGCWYEGKWYEDVGTLWGKQGRRTICVGFRKNEWPTHWMPLPEPTTTEETK